MVHMIILGAIVLAPVIAILIVRSQGAITFMSVCLGYVIMRFATADIEDALTGFFRLNPDLVSLWVKLIALLLPVVLAILFTIGAVKGSRRFINFLPALATGGLLALFAVPLLPGSIQNTLTDNIVWHKLSSAQTPVLLGGTFFSLLYFSIVSRARKAAESDKKHK